MTDRELLELAAKAASVPFDWCGSGVAINHGYGECGTHKGEWVDVWNPLTDDGDALRLAVKLFLDVRPAALDGTANCGSCYETHHHGDTQCIYAATRRAIVRAAAEIGRSME